MTVHQDARRRDEHGKPGGEVIEDLIASMTREQKLAQLQIAFRPRFEDVADLVRGGIGAVFWPRSAEATNELQRIACEETPHGIPLLIGLDVVHGQRTTFPVPLAQAASFDPAVAETDARISAREAASGGVNWTFSPMIDVSRDPRWGRVVEGFGEDTHVNSVFGAREGPRLPGAVPRRCGLHPRLRQALRRLRPVRRRPGLQHGGCFRPAAPERLP